MDEPDWTRAGGGGAEPAAQLTAHTRVSLSPDIRDPCHAATTLRYFGKFRTVTGEKKESLAENRII